MGYFQQNESKQFICAHELQNSPVKQWIYKIQNTEIYLHFTAVWTEARELSSRQGNGLDSHLGERSAVTVFKGVYKKSSCQNSNPSEHFITFL